MMVWLIVCFIWLLCYIILIVLLINLKVIPPSLLISDLHLEIE